MRPSPASSAAPEMLPPVRKFVFTLAAAAAMQFALGGAAPVLAAQTPPAKTVQAKKAVKTAVKKTSTAKVSAKRAAAKTPQKARAVKTSLQKKSVRRVKQRRAGMSPSQATLAGLRKTEDPLMLGSSVAYAVDQDTGEELVVKNADVPLPIASVTKLMTALVIAESELPLNEKLRVTREDYVRSTASSKLRSGMRVTRGALLQAALMSSDNRAAHALARTYPGGKRALVARMNERARELGMSDSAFTDPTGLDNGNHSTARDLSRLVAAVYEHQEIRRASTQPFATITAGKRRVNLSTTNRLIGDPSWRIGIQKTGFTTAAGRCMVVQSDVGERRLVMVVLDSPNNAQRANDMRTMRAYVEGEAEFRRGFEETIPYEIF